MQACFSCGKDSQKYCEEMEKLQRKYSDFNRSDLYLMVEWFHRHSRNGFMSQRDFLEGMGFTSHAGYIFKRMFKVMDRGNNSKVYTILNIDNH